MGILAMLGSMDLLGDRLQSNCVQVRATGWCRSVAEPCHLPALKLATSPRPPWGKDGDSAVWGRNIDLHREAFLFGRQWKIPEFLVDILTPSQQGNKCGRSSTCPIRILWQNQVPRNPIFTIYNICIYPLPTKSSFQNPLSWFVMLFSPWIRHHVLRFKSWIMFWIVRCAVWSRVTVHHLFQQYLFSVKA